MAERTTSDPWNDTTVALSPSLLRKPDEPTVSAGDGATSGTHRIASGSRGVGAEFSPPRLLSSDVLSAIVADFVARHAADARSDALSIVREELEGLGGFDGGLPQALAGQFVLALARRLPTSGRRSEFLGNSWLVLGQLLSASA